MDAWVVYSAIAKFALYLGVLGATGLIINALIFREHVWQTGTRFWVVIFTIMGLFATVASFLLRGASLMGEWSGISDPEILGILWQTPVGTVLIYRVFGCVIILGAMAMKRYELWLGIVGAAPILWSFGQIGHVADMSGVLVQMILLLHLCAASFWVGILIPLRNLVTNHNTHAQAGELGHQFGRVATWFIPALVLAGTYLSWRLVGGLSGLMSPYGLMLLAKVGMVTLLLGLGALNKIRFVPRLRMGEAAAAKHLCISVTIEGCLIVIILSVTALLTSYFSPIG